MPAQPFYEPEEDRHKGESQPQPYRLEAGAFYRPDNHADGEYGHDDCRGHEQHAALPAFRLPASPFVR